jgi:hypothetical protein
MREQYRHLLADTASRGYLAHVAPLWIRVPILVKVKIRKQI